MSRTALCLAALLVLSVSACDTPPAADGGATAAADSAATDGAAQTPASTPAVTPPVADASNVCDVSGAQWAVGQTASQDVVDKAVAGSHSSTARVIGPDQAVTMDFLEDRLNLEVDAGNVIKSVRCG